MKSRHKLILGAILLNTACSFTSSAAALGAGSNAVGPTITTQPANTTVKLGATSTFTVAASGTAPLSYQWYRNYSTNPITGATSPKYTTPATTDADQGTQFFVIVKNSIGSTQSNPASLTVGDPPKITGEPTGVTVTVPAFVFFNVYVSGSYPLTCQWYRDGHFIPGAIDCYAYSTPEVTTADNGASFFMTAKNAYGSATSKTAVITVKPANPTGSSPIVGEWSGTAAYTCICNNDDGGGTPVTATVQVTAVFSQTSYSITGTVVYTDEDGVSEYGSGIGSLNNLNLFAVQGAGGNEVFNYSESGVVNFLGAFSSNQLTLGGVAVAADGNGAQLGTGHMTISSDHNKLTGTSTDNEGGTMSLSLTRTK